LASSTQQELNEYKSKWLQASNEFTTSGHKITELELHIKEMADENAKLNAFIVNLTKDSNGLKTEK
jgi:hypothetical protein